MKLKYVVQINYYAFEFEVAEEAVAFAISAKLRSTDESLTVEIDFVEA